MPLKAREKRTVLVGGTAALAIAVVTWGVAPLWDSWRQMGDELAPKVVALQRTRERLDRRQALLARRARLVKQIGWVAAPNDDPDNSAKPGKEGKGGEAVPRPESGSQSPEGKPDARPPGRAGFEAELEKTAGKCKVAMKSLVSEKARPGVRLTCFEPRLFRVEAEANPEALVALLHALEKGPRLVRVDGLILRQDTSKPGPAKITLQIAAYERTAEAEGSKR